ncbi:MAG: metallophosphoesterase family protein [Cyclobacteriaceae bacterium]
MKLLHTADWHLGKRLMDFSRIEEQRQVLDELIEIAQKEQVDVVLVAGDLFDQINPSNEAIELFYQALHRLSNQGQTAVIVIAGNHDAPDRIEAPHPLAKECGIFLAGRPDSKIPLVKLESGLQIKRSSPGFIEINCPGVSFPLRLILTPYANEVTFRRYLGKKDQEAVLRKLLKSQWQTLAEKYCDDLGVNILMSHLYFMQQDGPKPEEPEDEKPILHMGGAQAIYTEAIPDQIQYTALGHLHQYQTVSSKSSPVIYSGSPLAYSFAEADQQKYVIIIEAEPGKRVETKEVPLSSGKRLYQKKFKDTERALAWLANHQEAYVELTLISDSFIEAATKRKLYQAHSGIIGIIPELTGDREASSSTKKIDLAQDRKTLFQDYFESRKGQRPPKELMDLLSEIIDTGP